MADAEDARARSERLRRELEELSARGAPPKGRSSGHPPSAGPTFQPPQLPTDGEALPEPTPEQQREAERLLREAHVARMRGNTSEATRLLEQAAQLALGSSEVLEAIGDVLASARRRSEAKAFYKRAVNQKPTNVSAERKLADLVFQESQALLAASGAFMATSEALVPRSRAMIFNALWPGFGQILMGDMTRGGILVGAWLVLIVLAITTGGVATLLRLFGQGDGSAHLGSLLPIVIAVAVYVYSFVDLGRHADAAPRRVERPQPPENLEF